jgi:hypothetical protein
MTVSFTLVIVALAATLSGCAREEADAGPPVASPSITASHERAPLGSPVDITYRFVVSAEAPRLDQNYRVLVHFLDADEEMMWTDDHDPPVPTTQWKAGDTIEYTRTTFIPIYPYIGEATVQVGLYSPRDQTRVPLIGADSGQRAYTVGKVQLLPQSENIFLIYKDGWHRAEVAHENATVEWQWTKKAATLSFRNPKRDALFYLQLDGRREVFADPQRVAVKMGSETLDSFEVSTGEPLIRKIPLTASQLGSGDMVDLLIEVDKTFVPASIPSAKTTDDRELGVRVFHAFVQPR